MTNNWLTKFDQNKQIVPGKKAELAARKDSFAQKVQAMRVATGKIESRRLYFRCTATSQGFHADFERTNPNERFRIARIEKELPATNTSGGFMAGLGFKCTRSGTAFDSREFDTIGWYCPWCKNYDGFVCCTDCGENVCKARTTKRADGEEWFICTPACGGTGTLITADKVYGAAAARRSLPAATTRGQKALSGKSRSAAALPPAHNNRLLEGRKK